MRALSRWWAGFRDWLYDAWGSWLDVVTLGVALLVLAVGCICGLGVVASKWDCDDTAKTLRQPTRWRLGSGCYIYEDGRWVPVDKWIWNTGN